MLIYSQSGPTDKEEAIVLLHAYPLNRHFWDAQVESLGKEGYRVIAPDLSGYGESAPLNENEVSMSGYVKHLFNLLDHLKIKKAVFAGCSMGGYIMFEIWRTYPNRVKGLIFCGSRCEADTEEGKAGRYKTIETLKQEGTKQMSEGMISKVFSANLITLKGDKVAQVKEWILKAPVVGAIHGSLAMANRVDSTPTLKTITVPTLLITGTDDPITGESIMKPMKDGISGSEMIVIKNAGHLAPFDSPD